ncbi:uncharacterized protein LOC142172435 [Nicotiana tabacum]|uniref:Uncharacterized protein LOC142172435 n=1 Tax=Nicotiana tabacum TaxID=4097 RepID=A0AC58T4I8_TOBAC
MTRLFWNVRGINKRYKQKEIKQYLIENHIKIAGLVEAKVKENNAQHVAGKIACTWSLLNNYGDPSNGRIWIMWDSRLCSIKKLASQAQYIHCHIMGKHNGVDCLLTVVYGINKPWLICGDFNAILYPQGRLYGVQVTMAEIKDFADCCHNLSLNELPWKGDYYTWSNKQQGSDRIYSRRLDRAMANDEWMLHYGHSSTVWGAICF